MRGFNLTTVLNIKIVLVVFALMLFLSWYNHCLVLEDENKNNAEYLATVANFLHQKTPPGVFSQTAGGTAQEQALRLKDELQPLLDDVCLPSPSIKFGFYSKQTDSIVALGPQFDNALFSGTESNKILSLHASDEPNFIIENSILWYGAKSVIYTIPIKENGAVAGYVFASLNQDSVATSIWSHSVNTFLGAFLMLMICVLIFRELFSNLKNDLYDFAESILKGNSYSYRSKIPEFTPILNYINQQTDKMLRLDRLNIIGEMAAGIAHEIRNPMTTVRGLLQFIGNKKEFVRHKDHFQLMVSELDRANDIITEFLSLSKNRNMQFQEHSLNSLIEDIFPMLQANALYSNCQLKLSLAAIPDVSFDKNSIRQYILNMVRNASDAMPNGGCIEIGTTIVGNEITLFVKDDGVGIPAEIKDKLGTPFFTTKDSGTGLGLAICYRIAQRHAARIEVDSELGNGTTFTLRFNQTKISTAS